MAFNTARVPPSGQPWWRFGMVWLVLAGPAAVIVAGFVTLWLALNTTDTVLPTHDAREGHQGQAQAPAVQARNHSLTPSKDSGR